MRIQSTDKRERLWNTLEETTAEGHTSQAFDKVAGYYNRMHGDTAAVPVGVLDELLQAAREEGSLTVEEIADIVDTPGLLVEAAVETSVGAK